MDLVTFYALYSIGGGATQAFGTLRFPSMRACEAFAQEAAERQPKHMIIDHACVADGGDRPSWAPDGRIVGVPLMLKDMSK